MRSTLDKLISELMEIKTFIKSIDQVNSAFSKRNDTDTWQRVLIRKRFDYAAFAVTLYTSFETFIENLITSYARLETRRPDYKKLPQKLIDKHLRCSAQLLRQRLGEGRYVGMDAEILVKNLFVCLSGTKPYTLNEAAITAHDANIRAKEVNSFFAMVGIEKILDRVCSANAMKAWYNASNGIEPPLQGNKANVARQIIDQRLDDIVERRNQVAHSRGYLIDELPGSDAMKDAVKFIESLAASIFGIVVGHYLQNNYVASTDHSELALRDNDHHVKNQGIVIVDKPSQRLYVGQPIFVVVKSTG
jgi:hypothetical protein